MNRLALLCRQALGRLKATPTTTLVAGDLVYRGSMALYWIILARALTPENVGLIALGNAVSVPVFTVLDAGFAQYAVRETVPRGANGVTVPSDVARSLGRRPLVAIGGTVVVTMATFALSRSMAGAIVGFLLGASFACDFIVQTKVVAYRARLNMMPDLLVKMAQGIGTLVVIALMAIVIENLSVLQVAAASTLTYGLLLLPLWLVPAPLQTVVEARTPLSPSRSGPGPSEGRRAFAFTAIIVAVYSRIDALLIQVALGPALLASYSIAFRLIEAGRIIPWAIGRVVLAAGSAGEAGSAAVVRRSRQFSIVIGSTASALIVVVGPSVMSLLFGRHYAEDGATALMVLGVSVALVGYTGPLLSAVLAAGREAVVVRVLLSVLAVIAIASVPGVIIGGLGGVAAAVVAGEAVGALRLRKHVAPVRMDRPPLAALAVAGLASGTVAVLLDPFSSARYTAAFGITICCSFAYWTVWSGSSLEAQT